tara:strand:- start:27460 stop:28137 length:678 start_codon:yes stop_codon:yes gene_type:complete
MDTSKPYIKMQRGLHEKPIPHTAVAYLAGLFDGEGTVSIRRVIKGENSYKLEIYVTNTNTYVLDWIVSEFGGKVYVYDRKDGIRKPQGKWHAHTQLAYIILKTIYPYLIIKKAHAKLGIEFVKALNRDASWHEGYAKRLKAIQGHMVKMGWGNHNLSQDQLQKMILEGFVQQEGDYFPTYWLLHKFNHWLPDCRYVATSMEQLWLAFVMKELYSKKWDGNDWVTS